MINRPSSRHCRTLAPIAGLGLGLMLLLSSGCQQALFPRDSPRHQFQTHQQMRGQYTPTQQPDVFGNPQPALRARLSQQR